MFETPLCEEKGKKCVYTTDWGTVTTKSSISFRMQTILCFIRASENPNANTIRELEGLKWKPSEIKVANWVLCLLFFLYMHAFGHLNVRQQTNYPHILIVFQLQGKGLLLNLQDILGLKHISCLPWESDSIFPLLIVRGKKRFSRHGRTHASLRWCADLS